MKKSLLAVLGFVFASLPCFAQWDGVAQRATIRDIPGAGPAGKVIVYHQEALGDLVVLRVGVEVVNNATLTPAQAAAGMTLSVRSFTSLEEALADPLNGGTVSKITSVTPVPSFGNIQEFLVLLEAPDGWVSVYTTFADNEDGIHRVTGWIFVDRPATTGDIIVQVPGGVQELQKKPAFESPVPVLKIKKIEAGQVLVGWGLLLPGWELQWAPTVLGPWTREADLTHQVSVTVDPDETARFWRLVAP